MNAFSISSSLLLALLWITSAGSLSASSVKPGDAVGRHTISVASLFPSSTCTSSSANKAFRRKSTLPVFHRDGPCNPRSSGEDSRNQAELLRLDNERVASIQSKLFGGVIEGQDQSLASGNVRLPARSGLSIGVLNYLVNVGLGTPKQSLTLVFDTGSDLTWTQCRPCAVSCYSQVDPIFDPSLSSSFRNISCTSTTCTQIASGTTYPPACAGSSCHYGQSYGDGSYTYGLFATDTLTLSPSDMINDFQFGCGQNNKGIFGRADGLIGLGRDGISLVKQTATKYGENFSYCLPDTSGSIGYLSLGNAGGLPAAFTPMLTLSYPTYYGIGMVGISVGGKQLSIPQSVFTKAGTIIDSGTTFTRLQKTAYNSLRNAFQQAMSNYPKAPPFQNLDTCYDLSNYNNPSIPSVAFQFSGGVTVNLAPINILYAPSKAQYCLAFVGNDNDSVMGIYGNTQQIKFEVIYDLPGSRIGFAANGC